LATTNQIQKETQKESNKRAVEEPSRRDARRATRKDETRALETYPRDEDIGNLPEKNQKPSTPKEPEELCGLSKPLFFLCKWRPACGTSDLWNLLRAIRSNSATVRHRYR